MAAKYKFNPFTGQLDRIEESTASGPTEVADGSITTDKIADQAVTNAKISDQAVTNAKIANNNITGNKLVTNAVVSRNLRDRAVTNSKIADDAVTHNKIGNNEVRTAHISNDAITNDKIADASVSSSQLANNAVTNSKIINNSITTDKIQDRAVTSDKIGLGAVTLNNIANGNVTSTKLANNTVTNSKIAVGAVTFNKIANGNVISTNLANNAVTSSKIDNRAVTTDKIALGAVTLNQIANGNVTSTKLANNAVTNSKIGNNVITTDKIEDGAITPEKLSFTPGGAANGGNGGSVVNPITNADWDGNFFSSVSTLLTNSRIRLPNPSMRAGQVVYVSMSPSFAFRVRSIIYAVNENNIDNTGSFDPNIISDFSRNNVIYKFISNGANIWIQLGSRDATFKRANFVSNVTNINSNTWDGLNSLEIQSISNSQSIILPSPRDRNGEEITVIVPKDYYPDSLNFRYYQGISLNSHTDPLEPQKASVQPNGNQKVFTFRALNAGTWLQTGGLYHSYEAFNQVNYGPNINNNTAVQVRYARMSTATGGWASLSGNDTVRLKYKGTYKITANILFEQNNSPNGHFIRGRIIQGTRIIKEFISFVTDPGRRTFGIYVEGIINTTRSDTVQIEFIGINSAGRQYQIQGKTSQDLTIERLGS